MPTRVSAGFGVGRPLVVQRGWSRTGRRWLTPARPPTAAVELSGPTGAELVEQQMVGNFVSFWGGGTN